MKTKFTFLFILITSFCLSQSKGINYKALIKDDSNNVLSNQNITIEFSILEGFDIIESDVVYVEIHSVSTDTNGIVIANIGEGTPDIGFNEDDYLDMDWGGFLSHFLKVRIDTGSGFSEMGTSEFKAVPYALFAESSNNSGLEAIEEGSGQGWRLIGVNPDNYGPIGYNAVDLSIRFANSTTHGATGAYSIAMGYRTTASGQSSFASGIGSIASQAQSTAMGAATIASGHNSVAMGQYTRAEAPNSTAIGIFNVGGGHPTMGSSTDPLFEIGNGHYVDGTNDVRTNALTVLKNGNATLAGTLTQNSDSRLKTNITKIQYGLNTILKLNPVSYNWKKYPEETKKSIGLIAQEVQPLIKEIVTVGIDKDKTLSLSYIELIPVLIKAMQEQQELINDQDNQIKDLTAKLEHFKDLDIRITHLEALNNTQQ